MSNEQEQIQSELSNLIQQDIVQIASSYAQNNQIDRQFVLTLIQDISLLKKYEVTYIHNHELDDIMAIFAKEFKDSVFAYEIAFLIALDYLRNATNVEFLQKFFVEVFLKVPKELFIDAFSIFNVLCGSVKELYGYFIEYVFNTKFLTLDDNLQIDCLYKAWNLSLQVYHDNEASQYAYNLLLKLFHQALHYQKTEVAFWLYYTPLHYYKSGVRTDIDVSNQEFKDEVEKPLENYILKYIVPKYNIQPNEKKISDGKKRVAFVMQRIIRHSTLNVFYTLVKALMVEKSDEYEFVIYDLNFPESQGSDLTYIAEFKALGIEYIDVHQKIFGNMNPTYSLLEKCIKTREMLIADEVDVLIGLHTRIEYIFLYATRTAPKQLYWYHASNAQYDIKGIDERITHAKAPINEFDFSMFLLPNDKSKTLPKIEQQEIDKARAQYPKESFVLGYIGRLIKIENEEYLTTIAEIMKQNPQTIFLACGGGDQTKIQAMVNQLGIAERFYFTGHVNPHLYGYVIDYFLASFSGGGESLSEFVAKGKPYLLKINKEVISKKELEMYEEGISNYGFTRVFALTKNDYIDVANHVIQDSLSRQNITDFVVKEHVNQDFGSVIYFFREVHYYSGKGFIELLTKFTKIAYKKPIEENLPKINFYKEKIYSKIKTKQDLEIDDFIEELSLGGIEERAYYNYILAEYFFNAKKYFEASVCIDRAWVMFGFQEYVLELFIHIHTTLKNFEVIYQAYKRIGMESEKTGDISKALYYYNKAHYNRAYMNNEDSFEYDFDIIDSIERMAKPYKKNKKIYDVTSQNKIKVAFLIYGFSHKNSSLLRVNLPWLRSIDSSKIDVHIFVIDKKHTFNEDSIKNASQILNMGHKIHIFPDEETDTKRLISITNAIKEFDADILITGAAMGKYEHAFIVATQPASKTIGFLYGPPEQFCYPFMDEVITFSYFPAMDAPAKFIKYVNPTYVPCKIIEKDKVDFLGIKSDNLVISTIGRYTKFQSKKFLKKVQDILTTYEHVVYIFIGVSKEEIDFSFDENIIERIIFTGWIDNSEEYLSVTDILIDTYPSGGGLTILDAFNYKIPTIMFKNDFSKKFSQKYWSLEREYMNTNELIIKDINSQAFDELLLKLINSKKLREEYGNNLNSYLKEAFIKKYIDFVNYKEILCVE